MSRTEGWDVSIVVATYNRAHLLPESLGSLLRLETFRRRPYEIVVVDNASTDATRETVEAIAEDAPVPVRYLYEANPGIAHARNRGIAGSAGGWVAFFDDDQAAEPAWLRGLLEVAARTGAKCVGGKVVLSTRATAAALESRVCRSVLGETFHGDAAGILSSKSLPGTGNVLIARSVFDSIGAFDISLARGCEDADLFRRMRRAGVQPWYAPGAVVSHIIPPYRLERAYILFSSRRQGANYALLDLKEGGRRKVALSCAGRIGQALLVHLPSLLRARFRGDAGASLDGECLLSKASGYFQGAVLGLLPGSVAPGSFLSRMDYRAERERFGETGPGGCA